MVVAPDAASDAAGDALERAASVGKGIGSDYGLSGLHPVAVGSLAVLRMVRRRSEFLRRGDRQKRPNVGVLGVSSLAAALFVRPAAMGSSSEHASNLPAGSALVGIGIGISRMGSRIVEAVSSHDKVSKRISALLLSSTTSTFLFLFLLLVAANHDLDTVLVDVSTLAAAVLRIQRVKGAFQGQNLVGQQPKGVDIRLFVVVFSLGDFRTHVPGGSDLFGHLEGLVAVVTPVGLVGEDPGDVEIKDLEGSLLVETNIVGFQVAVNNSLGMQKGNRPTQILQQIEAEFPEPNLLLIAVVVVVVVSGGRRMVGKGGGGRRIGRLVYFAKI